LYCSVYNEAILICSVLIFSERNTGS